MEKIYVLEISMETSDCPEFFNCVGVFKTYEGAKKHARRLIKSWDADYKISQKDESEYGYIDKEGNCSRIGAISISQMRIRK